MSSPLFLAAVADDDLDEHAAALMEALRPIVTILEARPHSGLMLTLTLEVEPTRLAELGPALEAQRAPLDVDSVAKLTERVARGASTDTLVFLTIRFRRGNSDRRRDVPSVPG